MDLRIAERVIARFKVGRRAYCIEMPSGFDEASGIIWLNRDTDLNDALFDALAQRIFRQGSPRFAIVLQNAIRGEYRETMLALHERNEADETIGDDSEASDSKQEQGETRQTHRPTLPDSTRNVPHPGPVPQQARFGTGRAIQKRAGQQKMKQAKASEHELELTQIEDLKQNQYAWHCQVCLTEKTPRELAPEGSYVALAENRRLIIEAEHADQKHAGGARNAGNLILLCHFHHHQLGNALTRKLLTDALRHATETRRIEFCSGASKEQHRELLEGRVVSVCPPSLGVTVQFFFTSAHRQYWIDVADGNFRTAGGQST